jgi:hypothetical protein
MEVVACSILKMAVSSSAAADQEAVLDVCRGLKGEWVVVDRGWDSSPS